VKLDYFMKKQELFFAKTTTTYVRIKYFYILKTPERLIGLIGPREKGLVVLLYSIFFMKSMI